MKIFGNPVRFMLRAGRCLTPRFSIVRSADLGWKGVSTVVQLAVIFFTKTLRDIAEFVPGVTVEIEFDRFGNQRADTAFIITVKGRTLVIVEIFRANIFRNF